MKSFCTNTRCPVGTAVRRSLSGAPSLSFVLTFIRVLFTVLCQALDSLLISGSFLLPSVSEERTWTDDETTDRWALLCGGQDDQDRCVCVCVCSFFVSVELGWSTGTCVRCAPLNDRVTIYYVPFFFKPCHVYGICHGGDWPDVQSIIRRIVLHILQG